MKSITIAAALALSGCAGLGLTAGDIVPTMKYCDAIHYERIGQKIKITAECKAPVSN